MNKNSNLTIIVFLGIIWSSFALFTKVAAEELPPFFIAFARLAIGCAVLIPACLLQQKKFFFANNLKKFAIVGFFNSALPFTLFAISAKNLDSGAVAILDGTVPMFEVLLTMFVLKNHVNKNSIFGVILGIIGVVVISIGSAAGLSSANFLSVIFILVATASYAAAALYISANCKNIDPLTNAAGSVLIATLMLSPSLFFTDFNLLTVRSGLALLGLGTLCTGIAYLFGFKLIAEEGARVACSVVLLIPVFGLIYGTIFIGEVVSLTKIIGCIMILVSMKFILNLSLNLRSLKPFTKN